MHPYSPKRDLKAQFEEIMLLLGFVANAWADIEDKLCTTFMHLAETDAYTSDVIFYTPSGFRARLQMLNNLIKHKMPDGQTRDALVGVLAKLNELGTTRNNFIHASYAFVDGRDGYLITRRNTRPSKRMLRTEGNMHKGELERHIDQLERISSFFIFLNNESETRDASYLRKWATAILHNSEATSA